MNQDKNMTATRKLAVIMFTDIAAYTDLMGRDRDRALDLLLKNKELHKELVEKDNGELLKEIGDGNMCTFDTASDAIDCALALQQASGTIEDLNLRIGIHLGEIMVEEGDAFGDGVNIASRLQSIADPGEIYISDSIQKAIRGRVESLFILFTSSVRFQAASFFLVDRGSRTRREAPCSKSSHARSFRH